MYCGMTRDTDRNNHGSADQALRLNFPLLKRRIQRAETQQHGNWTTSPNIYDVYQADDLFP